MIFDLAALGCGVFFCMYIDKFKKIWYYWYAKLT